MNLSPTRIFCNKKLIQKIQDGNEKDIAEAYEKLSYTLLCRAIDDHLTKEFGSDSLDEINMLNEFCRYREFKGEIGANDDDNALSDDYINKCQELFELLSADGSDKAEEVFIPLYIDKSSGAGVYILGRAHLNLSEPEKARLPNLGKCGVYTAGFYSIEGYDYYNGYEVNDGSVEGVNMLFEYEIKSFEGVQAAFADFKDNYEKNDYYFGYQGLNSNAFYAPVKEKLGGTFLRYFDRLKETRRTERERAVIENQIGIEKEMKKKYG